MAERQHRHARRRWPARAASSSALPPPATPNGTSSTLRTTIASARPVHPREGLAHPRAEQDVGAPEHARPAAPAPAPVVSMPAPPRLASSTMPAAASVTHTRSSARREPMHRHCQRPRELDRHRHALRDPVDRLVEAQVHERQRHARTASARPSSRRLWSAPARAATARPAPPRRRPRAGTRCRSGPASSKIPLASEAPSCVVAMPPITSSGARHRVDGAAARSPPPRYLQSGGCPCAAHNPDRRPGAAGHRRPGAGPPQRGRWS